MRHYKKSKISLKMAFTFIRLVNHNNFVVFKVGGPDGGDSEVAVQ